MDITHSPCTICTDDLVAAARLTPGAEKATRHLTWREPYVDKRRTGVDNRSTTDQSLGKVAAGWTVIPGSIGGPPKVSGDEKDQEKSLVPYSPVIRRRRT